MAIQAYLTAAAINLKRLVRRAQLVLRVEAFYRRSPSINRNFPNSPTSQRYQVAPSTFAAAAFRLSCASDVSAVEQAAGAPPSHTCLMTSKEEWDEGKLTPPVWPN
jgi:hypothetical protein